MFVKICGVTDAHDFQMITAAGADAIGLNFVPHSKRHLTIADAKQLIRSQSGRRTSHQDAGKGRREKHAELWGVFAQAELEYVHQVVDEVGLDVVQLHGGESAEFVRLVRQLGVRVVRVQPVDPANSAAPLYPADLLDAEKFVMLDTAVNGRAGGTGQTFDWRRLDTKPLPGGRKLILAGGLTPDNVARAVAEAKPWGVDVAGGVCLPDNPRRKSSALVKAFIAHARGHTRETEA